MVIERMDRCLRVVSRVRWLVMFLFGCLCLGWLVWFFWLMCLVSRVGWLVCVRRLLPLIPPHGVGVGGSEIVWLVVTG